MLCYMLYETVRLSCKKYSKNFNFKQAGKGVAWGCDKAAPAGGGGCYGSFSCTNIAAIFITIF